MVFRYILTQSNVGEKLTQRITLSDLKVVIRFPKDTSSTTPSTSSSASTSQSNVTTSQSGQNLCDKDKERKDINKKGEGKDDDKKDGEDKKDNDCIVDQDMQVFNHVTIIVLRKDMLIQLAILKFPEDHGKISLVDVKKEFRNLDTGYQIQNIYSAEGIVNFDQASDQAWEAYSTKKKSFIISVTVESQVCLENFELF